MGQQVKLLKHEPEFLVPKIGEGVVIECLNSHTVEAVMPVCGAIEAAKDIHGRAFAGSTHPGDHNQLVTGDADGDVAQVVFAGSLDADPTGIVSRFSPRGHGSHPLGGLEAKRLEAGLEHTAREVAQG